MSNMSYVQHGALPPARNDSAGIVRVLLASGASASKSAPDGRCALHVASSIDVVRVLLDARADASVGDSRGRTPLHSAASVAVVEALIAAKAPVNAHDHTGVTPLLAACERGDVAVVRVLLAAGADPTISDASGRSALHCAASGTGPHADEVVSSLIAAGAAVDSPDSRGITPLFLAVKRGDAASVEALILGGASVHARSTQGEAPLHWVHGADVARVLLAHGANPNSLDDQFQARTSAARGACYTILLVCWLVS
jgi:ankyrin repeat protein